MEATKINYQSQMLDAVSEILETTGKSDPAYSNEQKALDIFHVLESLLSYTIFTVCLTSDQIRDTCEESYLNIKRNALAILEREKNQKTT
jgi:hypothetical protein